MELLPRLIIVNRRVPVCLCTFQKKNIKIKSERKEKSNSFPKRWNCYQFVIARLFLIFIFVLVSGFYKYDTKLEFFEIIKKGIKLPQRRFINKRFKRGRINRMLRAEHSVVYRWILIGFFFWFLFAKCGKGYTKYNKEPFPAAKKIRNVMWWWCWQQDRNRTSCNHILLNDNRYESHDREKKG